MRILFCFLILLSSIALTGQETFAKIYDFFNGVDDTAYNMFVIHEEIHIVGRGDCDEGRCLHYYVLGIDGEIIRTKRYPDIWPALYGSQRDSSIFVAGFLKSDTLDDGYRLIELNLKGDVIRTAKYDQYALAVPPDYDIYTYEPRGAIVSDEKIVVFGDTRETDAINDNFRRGLLMYYNKDLSFDTLVFINLSRDMEMWRAALDSQDNFVFVYDYDKNENGVNADYRTIARYDNEGNELFRWEPPELYHETQFLIPLLVTQDDNYLTFISTVNSAARDEDLIFINENGEQLWRIPVVLGSVDIGIAALSETKEGDILMAGLSDSYFRGGYISKYDSENGDLIWDRAFLDWDDDFDNNAAITFFSVEELSDGTILVAGRRTTRTEIDSVTTTSQRDLYLMRLDSLGCLEPGCGGLEQHIAGQPKYIDITNHIHRWLYQKYDTPLGIFKQRYRYVSLVEMYQENRAEEELGIISDEGWFHGSPTKLLRPENDGRKVYYIADYDVSQEEVLLYDFTLEVGDLFMSDYIAQPLEVIESDTMRLSDRSKMRYWVLACTENPENTITWMENIGTYHGVVWPSNFCSGDYGDETLTCFYRHERFAHMNPAVSDCLLPSSTDEKVMDTLSEITAIPNPTSGFITISAPDDLQIARLELLDTNGVTHESFPVKTSEVRMDLSGYPSGLYFVSVHTEQGSVVKKVVVDD